MSHLSLGIKVPLAGCFLSGPSAIHGALPLSPLGTERGNRSSKVTGLKELQSRFGITGSVIVRVVTAMKQKRCT